jgi:GT2 family glycosyltransferase
MEKNIVSLVLYNFNVDQIINFVQKIYSNNSGCLIFLIDNSSKNNIQYFEKLRFVKYIKSKTNIGFGKGHNISISYCIENDIKYCFIMNYDIDFDIHIFDIFKQYMEENSGIAMLMPKVVNKDYSQQWLPKLQPSPLSILKRKLFHMSNNILFRTFINKYEFRNVDTSKNYNVPNLSGCFFLLNIGLLKYEALFDERYFLYFEDYDLSRKLTSKYKTVLNNHSFVIHDYQSMANKKVNLFLIFFSSYCKFFSKWGWFNPTDLKKINTIYIVK